MAEKIPANFGITPPFPKISRGNFGGGLIETDFSGFCRPLGLMKNLG